MHHDRFVPHNSNSVGPSPLELVAPQYLKKLIFTPINIGEPNRPLFSIKTRDYFLFCLEALSAYKLYYSVVQCKIANVNMKNQ